MVEEKRPWWWAMDGRPDSNSVPAYFGTKTVQNLAETKQPLPRRQINTTKAKRVTTKQTFDDPSLLVKTTVSGSSGRVITAPKEWASLCLSDPVWLATSLDRLCRFGGQYAISVMRHSMFLSGCLKSHKQQLWALLHDAHELLSGDCCRPFVSPELSRQQKVVDLVLHAELHKHRIVISDSDVRCVLAADRQVGNDELERPADFARYYERYSVADFVGEFRSLVSACEEFRA